MNISRDCPNFFSIPYYLRIEQVKLQTPNLPDTFTGSIRTKDIKNLGAWVGTVENHGKKWQKTRHTFVKIAEITAKSRQFI